MADISNAYRSEVRDLIKRRIALARKKLLEVNKPAVDKAREAAEKDPALMKLPDLRCESPAIHGWG